MNRYRLLKDAQFPAIALVYLSGLVQGLTLVSFPALGPMLKSALPLSDSAYGALFLPQVLLAGVGAIAGGTLAARFGLPALLKLALAANALSQSALLLGVYSGGSTGLVLLFFGTAFLGLGFGLSAAPLNRYPFLFFPSKPESALTALHTMIGTGLAIGPYIIGRLADLAEWWLYPAALTGLALTLLVASTRLNLSEDNFDGRAPENITDLLREPVFRLLLAVAMVYALCEGLFSNWAVIFLQEDKQLDAQHAGLALSAFWAAMALGRLLTSYLVTRLPAKLIWLSFPLLMVSALECLPTIDSEAFAIAVYAFAGFACSGFFPLTVFQASSRYPRQVALVSASMVAALMAGVGLGSFALGGLRAVLPLPEIFRFSVALPILAGVLGLAAMRHIGKSVRPASVSDRLSAGQANVGAGFIVCPACGGENPQDAVFCLNHECHKALGEFKYVLEELMATKNWLERLADRVSAFVSHPQFIVLHLLWFGGWILANEIETASIGHFDNYPYDLLSIILAIEAVLITGFLLISQNHQYNYSEKRAELDYEVNVRSYRKLIELEKRLSTLIIKYQERLDENV